MSEKTFDAAEMRAALAQMTTSVDLVKQLLASGVISAEALGLVTAPGPIAVGARGPGERITVADLTVKALASCSHSTARTYGSYMRLLANGDASVLGPNGKPYQGIGTMWADEVLPSDLRVVLEVVQTRQVRDAAKRAGRREAADRVVRDTDGSGALYNAVGAWRCMFAVAIAERSLSRGFNPASDVKKPKRQAGTREALEPVELTALLELFAGTGDDPELDTMICKSILITGARQEGVLNLHLGGIDLDECTVRLDEKNAKVVHQPVPDWFTTELRDFALSRGASRLADRVFTKRTRSGSFKPIGPRRLASTAIGCGRRGRIRSRAILLRWRSWSWWPGDSRRPGPRPAPASA